MEMAAVAPGAEWIPEDDLLLKDAVEEGASLEALAKGAVEFSRRFTYQELKDRWYSLLYDPDISAQASAGMGKLQSSGSTLSSELDKSEKAIQSKMVLGKRKIGTIRKQYYAMRKRIQNEFFNSADLVFLDEPHLHQNGDDFHERVALDNGLPAGNCMVDDCMTNRFGLQETDFDILHDAFPQTMMDIDATDDVANIGDAFYSEGPHSLVNNNISRVARNNCLEAFPEHVSSLLAQESLKPDGTEHFQQSSVQKDIPHRLEDHSIDLGMYPGAEEMGSTQPLSGTKLFQVDDSEPKPAANNLQNDCSDISGRQQLNSPKMGLSSPLSPGMPIWKTMEDFAAPALPVNVSPEDKILDAEDAALPDIDESNSKSLPVDVAIHSGPILTDVNIRNVDGFSTSSAISDGEFASDSLLDFSHEEEILFMDVDGKGKMDQSCYDNSPLLSSPKDVNVGDATKVEPQTVIASITVLANDNADPVESEVITSHLLSVQDDHQSIYSGVNMSSTAVLLSKPLDLAAGHMYCTLNSEDPDIPCNDDIFLLIHPTASFVSSASRPITIDAIDPVFSASEKETGQGLNFRMKGEDPAESLAASQKVGVYMLSTTSPDHGLAGCMIRAELADGSCMAFAPRHTKKAIGDANTCRSAHITPNSVANAKLDNDVKKVELQVVDTACTFGEIPLHVEAGSFETTLPELSINPSTSDQEEPESDTDVPYFSDIEAMILDMDLGSYDEESYFTNRVSKYQQEGPKRRIIRLEQCAQSSLRRAMAFQGALAILYGRHSKHYIRKTEVVLGRSTDESDVDIDLGKEGRANKISRRQATIKMERDGSFLLKNLGKSSISVNGKAVENGQSLGLTSSCLIEIRGMSFVFEMNHKFVKRYLHNIAKKSGGTNFEFSPGGGTL